MTKAEVPDSLRDQDPLEGRLVDLAVGLYQGRGGAGELARVIAEQAKLTAERRASAARQRAALVA